MRIAQPSAHSIRLARTDPMKTPLYIIQYSLTPMLMWSLESVLLELQYYSGNKQPTLDNEVNSLLPQGSVSVPSESVDVATFSSSSVMFSCKEVHPSRYGGRNHGWHSTRPMPAKQWGAMQLQSMMSVVRFVGLQILQGGFEYQAKGGSWTASAKVGGLLQLMLGARAYIFFKAIFVFHIQCSFIANGLCTRVGHVLGTKYPCCHAHLCSPCAANDIVI